MKNSLLFFFVFITFSAIAQEHKHDNHHFSLQPKDSVCLRDCLLKAHWEAHTRSFFMSTFNEEDLKDDYALASGAGIGVLTQPIKGFQVGVSGFFIYKLFSSNIGDTDEVTKAANRYEAGLFDIEDPDNKNDLDRLEELYLKYNFSKSSIMAGKFNLNTPFFNPQDGRMRPTLEEGVWTSINENEKFGFNGGWIWDVSPRSTVKWYRVGESIGVYPSGVNIDGSKSNYSGNIESAGIGVVNVYYIPNKSFKINVWNGYVENVMNSAMLEVNSNKTILNDKFNLYHGFIYMHQNAVNDGGNKDQSKTYFVKNQQSNIISTQVGVKNRVINTALSYTHITSDGRYLMPREWGREVFYTFMPRERNEGLGNLHAIVLKTTYTANNKNFKTSLAYGFFKLPDVKDFRLNKYGLPSYHQFNYEVSYNFPKFLKGLEVRMLAAYKLKQGETYNNPKYVYNKVNMLNLSVIADFKI